MELRKWIVPFEALDDYLLDVHFVGCGLQQRGPAFDENADRREYAQSRCECTGMRTELQALLASEQLI